MSLAKQIQVVVAVGAIIIGASSLFINYVALEHKKNEASATILGIYLPEK